jgi:GntR family transcriptional regulator/MocR family aminotransferase
MLPWKTIIKIQKSDNRPVYLQFTDAIIREIKSGLLKPGTKIPGTRIMAGELELNRQTVVKAYDELYSQGWLELVQSKGTFVSEKLPEIQPKKLQNENGAKRAGAKNGFRFKINKSIHSPSDTNRHILGFHDGPDVRLVPAALLSRGYKSVLSRKSGLLLLSYIDVRGRETVRKAISEYLNESRGLQTTEKNILIARGTQMAMYMLAAILFKKGDKVICAIPGFRYAELTFENAGAQIVKVPVDEDGMDIDAVEQVCKRQKIRALYVTSHHHYPTAVTLTASRRMRLLHLAEKYGFVILEDDYDYEFHYESSPILPLASADHHGMVVYIGSFSKTIAPGIRMGYVVAHEKLLTELAKLRMLIDVQGDAVVEEVIGEMLADGEIRRHMKKTLRIYKERRDFTSIMLQNKLSDAINFKIPDGGLSIWAKFDKKFSVPQVHELLFKKNIIISKGLLHDASAGKKLNCTRIGFGWMDINETEMAIEKLAEVIRKFK